MFERMTGEGVPGFGVSGSLKEERGVLDQARRVRTAPRPVLHTRWLKRGFEKRNGSLEDRHEHFFPVGCGGEGEEAVRIRDGGVGEFRIASLFFHTHR